MRFFREIITVVAGLVALLLIAALAGPHFIDWNKHRPVIVEALERATGAKIKVAGDLDLRLLPSPRLKLADVSIAGKSPSAPQLDAAALNLELGLTALFRGQFRFIEAQLERPVIALSMTSSGGIVLPDLPVARSGQIAFEHVALRDAKFLVKGADGQSWLIDGVNLEASGQSLKGPFRGNGSFVAGGERITYLFNTGLIENEAIRTKFVTESAAKRIKGEFDGTISLRGEAGGGRQPSFAGTAVISGTLVLPGGNEQSWRASGPATADITGMRSETFEFRSGEAEQALAATGSLLAQFPRRATGNKSQSGSSVHVSLAARQINADAILGGEDGPAAAMRRLSEGLAKLAAHSTLSTVIPAPVDLRITADAFLVGRETLSNVTLAALIEPGKPLALVVSAGAPGSTKVRLDGKLETGIAAQFSGGLSLATRDMRRLEQWLSAGLPAAARIAGSIPYRAFRLTGALVLSRAGLNARNLAIATGRSRFDGAIIYTKATGKERSRLFVDLASPALDINGLGDFSAPAKALGDIDFDVTFNARATRLARFGKGVVDAGSIALHMVRKDGAVRLPQLRIKNLGGANVSAIGSLLAGKGRADISVQAKNLVELSQVLARVAPGAWSQALVDRAAALSPADVKITLQGASGGNGALSLSALELAGNLNGSNIKVRSTPDTTGAAASGSLSVQADKSAVLLRQLGLPAISLTSAGKASVEAVWKNKVKTNSGPRSKAHVDVKAQIAGTRFNFTGEAAKFLPMPDLQGRLSITSSDVVPLLQSIAFALPSAAARAAVDLNGAFAWRGERVSAGSITGSIAGSKLTGQAVLSPRKQSKDISRQFLSGTLRFDQLGLRGLTALVFGPDPGGGGTWRRAPFQSAAGDFPPAELEVQAGRLDLPAGQRAENARFTMRLSPGVLVLDNLLMATGATTLRGRLSFRSDKATSAMSGDLKFSAPGIGLHGISGGATGQIEFAATGKSEAEMIAGLAGKGAVRIKNLSVAGADPRAISRVLKATDAERLELTESGVRAALRKNFTAAPLAFDQKNFAVTIAGGAARLVTEDAQDLPGSVNGELSAVFNLRSMQGLAKLGFVARQRPKDWTGALPAVSLERVLQLQTTKPADTGTSISASSFVNGVSARAIVREVARMEALEFDIRERAYFNRQVKTAEFLSQRKVEIAAWRIEQARLAEEARKRAEEEARRKAAAEAKRKAAEEKAALKAERKRKAEEARLKVIAERKAAQEARRKAIEERKAQRAAQRAAAKAAAEKAQAARVAKRQAAENARRALRDAARAGGGNLPARTVPLETPPAAPQL